MKYIGLLIIYAVVGAAVFLIAGINGGRVFLAVLFALIAYDFRKSVHRVFADSEARYKKEVEEHNRLMNLRDREGNVEMAKMHAKYYSLYLKDAENAAWWNSWLS